MLSNSTSKDRRCNECWFKISQFHVMTVYNFIVQILRQFVNWGFTYIVAIFYSTICTELNRIVCKLIKDIQLQNFHLHQEKRQHYRDVVRTMMGLEDSLSLIIFLVFCNCFNEFFRGITQLLFHPEMNARPRIWVIAFAYFLGSSITFATAVFTADNLQQNFAFLRKTMLETSEFKSEFTSLPELLQCDLELLEDKDNLQLTAWGMFSVKKGLMITALASLISYSVILGQLKL
ncbi:uncharacterized protein CDAR_223331 [Caerostris darwini]|uniref:Uncharacterized protein n=1 Tax=Caerostris darwini TaxID=1538125 RepID=A0AAV4W8K0_9ARAC|nr:uncharacterized protein CDAR_223331 [Caerostris darwini]